MKNINLSSLPAMPTCLFFVLACFISSPTLSAQNTFITSWKTDNPGTSSSTSITIPTLSGRTYNYDVDWNNDGTFDDLGLTTSATHDYGTAGTYTVAIRGTFPSIYFNNGGDKDKIVGIHQWGDIAWGSMVAAFYGCSNLTYDATDAPDLSALTSLSGMFRNCSAFNGNLNNWDVSNIIDLNSIFASATSFNQPLNNWDVSNVISMLSTFNRAAAFNRDLSSWNTSKVTTMSSMFYEADAFNQDLSGWDVSSVTVMSFMFGFTDVFNGDVTNWNVSGVTNMAEVFRSAAAFNQDLSGWDISNVTNMSQMLNNSAMDLANYDATLIGWAAQSVQNGVTLGAAGLKYCAGESARNTLINTGGWTITGDTPDCLALSETYFITSWKTDNPGTSSSTSITIPTLPGRTYNYDVDWNNDGAFDDLGLTTSATHDYGTAGTYTVAIRGAFPAIYFNDGGDKEKILSIDQWGDIQWTSMGRAFQGCSNLVYNATDVPDLSGVTSLAYIFSYCTAFNGNLNNWEVSGVIDMSSMFAEASSFNQPLNDWDVSGVAFMNFMFSGAGSFNQPLNNWDVSGVTDMGGMFFEAGSFNHPLNNWDISGVTDMSDMLASAGLSTANYDATLIGWAAQSVQNGVALGADDLEYCAGESARNTLIDTYGWTISGDSKAASCGTGDGTCENPIVLNCGDSVSGDNTGRPNTVVSDGPEVIYTFELATAGDVAIQLTNLSADLDLGLLSACNLDGVLKTSETDGNESENINVNLSAGTYYIIVVGFNGAESTFDLSLTCDGGSGNCSSPPPATGTIAAGTYQVSGAMTTAGQVLAPSVVTLKAGTSISLTAGFIAAAGSTFSAMIEECVESLVEVDLPAEELIESTPLVANPTDLAVYPNPFRQQTTIKYHLEKSTTVDLGIYDLNGRRIAQPVRNILQDAGDYQVIFRADDQPKGIYLAVMRTDDGIITRRLVLMD